MQIQPFKGRIWLSSPTMHGEEMEYMRQAYETNWMSTVGANIDAVEQITCEKLGCKYAVALSSGTAALHMAVRYAGIRLYGEPKAHHGSLKGRKVFCSDMTFDASVNPVAYEGGEAVFIDTEYDTWNMDPKALERAFELYPEVQLVVVAHLYGTPAKMDRIREICDRHDALIVEDAAESLGASYQGKQTGTLGEYGIISFNGNKIITGSSGGMFVTDEKEAADKVRKWSTQSRDNAPWYQHSELGYNYRMSNVIAGVVRGQYPHLEEHIEQKRAIYERYQEGLKDLPVRMNPCDIRQGTPNYWLSCMIIDEQAMGVQKRAENTASYTDTHGKSCPTEILEVLAELNAEGRPIWKPMHMQPMYQGNAFVKAFKEDQDVGADIFARGVCLPSDNKLAAEQQEIIIDVIHRCFE
ncbi:MAG: DegT/DnrJ/EryC1/StrS family aminotransferase [Bacillota bacterium]|nr:DegT/DnrJ/EryC1/StrS family aminotransferase [Bacillota bacterium]